MDACVPVLGVMIIAKRMSHLPFGETALYTHRVKARLSSIRDTEDCRDQGLISICS